MNFYNEHDPKAAAWLRELIKAKEIPKGIVDERSITEIKAHELTNFVQCHFFAGIGGWSYALKLAGWPENRPVWTGSCPCQPFSSAGQQKGTEDERHLWPVFADLIKTGKPPVVFGEQVASKLGREWLAGVFADLERMGYSPAGADLCAAGIGAPHIRQRLYWVADSNVRRTGSQSQSSRQGEQSKPCSSSTIGRLANPEMSGCENNRLAGPEKRVIGAHDHSEISMPRDGSTDRRIDGSTDAQRLEHSEQSRLEGHSWYEHDRNQPGRNGTEEIGSTASAGAPWDSFDILPCLDGKARRVESGTFPLAHGVPGRVGLLRGYGNAIVPPLAQKFIEAYCEAVA